MLQVNHIHLSYGPRLILDDGTIECLPVWARYQFARQHRMLEEQKRSNIALQHQLARWQEEEASRRTSATIAYLNNLLT